MLWECFDDLLRGGVWQTAEDCIHLVKVDVINLCQGQPVRSWIHHGPQMWENICEGLRTGMMDFSIAGLGGWWNATSL